MNHDEFNAHLKVTYPHINWLYNANQSLKQKMAPVFSSNSQTKVISISNHTMNYVGGIVFNWERKDLFRGYIVYLDDMGRYFCLRASSDLRACGSSKGRVCRHIGYFLSQISQQCLTGATRDTIKQWVDRSQQAGRRLVAKSAKVRAAEIYNKYRSASNYTYYKEYNGYAYETWPNYTLIGKYDPIPFIDLTEYTPSTTFAHKNSVVIIDGAVSAERVNQYKNELTLLPATSETTQCIGCGQALDRTTTDWSRVTCNECKASYCEDCYTSMLNEGFGYCMNIYYKPDESHKFHSLE